MHGKYGGNASTESQPELHLMAPKLLNDRNMTAMPPNRHGNLAFHSTAVHIKNK